MTDRKSLSYQAANTFPMKLLLHPDVIEKCRYDHKIVPVHPQLNITNRCNFKCAFCSCRGRDRSLELTYHQIHDCMLTAASEGSKAVTITGGGDPLLHKDFNRVCIDLWELGLEVGLVTNGSLLHKISDEAFECIKWIRISSSDELPIQIGGWPKLKEWLKGLRSIVKDHPLDWAFSHVLTKQPKYGLIASLLNFANAMDFTHVRIVNDILIAEDLSEEMKEAKAWIQDYFRVDDSKVNWQDRSTWVPGSNPCYISLLKPVIGADGWIYPCCGTQYALQQPSFDYEVSMRMGKMNDLPDLIRHQKYFNGQNCVKCYYSPTNLALDVMLQGMDHENFV